MKLEVQNFLESSSIHGLAYVSRRFHLVERIFWAVTLMISAICTFTLIIKLAIKLQNFPIIIYLSDTSVPVSEINFPAVTVCPNFIPFRPLSYRKEFKLEMNYKYEKHTAKIYYYEPAEHIDESEDERKFMNFYKKFNYLNFLNRLEKAEIDAKKLGHKILKRLQVIDLVTKRGIFQKLNLSVPSDDFLDVINEFDKEFLTSTSTIGFSWLGNYFQHVSEIITPHGLCFTFNMAFLQEVLNLTSTSEDFHFQLFHTESTRQGEIRKPEILPRKTSTTLSGLHIYIDIFYNELKHNFKEVITSDIDGFMFYLHDPFEIPSSSSKSIYIKNNKKTVVLIEALLYSLDESLVHYDPVDRNCYLDNEQKLKFFKKYTKANCIQECLSDFMISRCGCVEFFMIRNSTTRICRGNEKNCFDNARNDFESQDNSCECLQPCNHIKYDFEFIEMFTSDSWWISEGISLMDIGMTFQFGDTKFNKVIRRQQLRVVDFLSFAGGLLGLFAGFSVMSFVELIYWFTVRLIFGSCRITSTRVVPYRRNEHLTKNTKASNILVMFLKESSIHGMQFVTKFGFLDKILWTFLVTMSMTTCFILISRAREKVPDSRVIALVDNLLFVGNISFPAFTIVPEYYINLHKSCPDPSNVRVDFNNALFKKVIECAFCAKDYDYAFRNRTKFDVQPFVLSMIKEKSELDWFKQQFSTLNEKFIPIYAEIRTDRGMGYSFGLLDVDELLDFDTIHESFRFFKNVTTRSNGNWIVKNFQIKNGMEAKLILNLKKLETNVHMCIQLGIIVHEHDKLPTFLQREEFMSLVYGTELNIEVTPEVMRTDESLKQLSPQTRECFFDGEKKLNYFKKYSQQNCITECLANFVIEQCNCSKLSHPFRELVFCSEKDRIPGYRSCLDTSESEFFQDDILAINHKCSCLPSCDSVTYHVKYFRKFSKDSDEISINLRVSTEDVILYRRYQQFTFSDVLSYVGGLLGLFAGISMLSIVEIFYFFVIRVIVNIFRSFKN